VNAQETDVYGAIVRSDTEQKIIFLCFTGHDYFEGFDHVLRVLRDNNIKGSFFLTGDFVRNHEELVQQIAAAGHFVGAHSDKHLLYNDWEKRDSLLVSTATIRKDILDNVRELESIGIFPKIFMPPFEWYNAEVVETAKAIGQTTVNFTPGTRSNADYTTPDMKNYISSQEILSSIYTYESTQGMSGFHLLIHPGVDSMRTDKFYLLLENLIQEMRERGYGFDRF
jgi:peptidoglycan/xylan/chitin deacetylase (PgdA/CDA1 family)